MPGSQQYSASHLHKRHSESKEEEENDTTDSDKHPTNTWGGKPYRDVERGPESAVKDKEEEEMKKIQAYYGAMDTKYLRTRYTASASPSFC